MAHFSFLRYNRSYADKNPKRFASKKDSRKRKHLRDDRRARRDAGHTSAKNRGGQPYAHTVNAGNPTFAAFDQHSLAAGRFL